MNPNEQFIENRSRVDGAIQALLLETREIVWGLVEPLATQGRFSLEIIPADSRGNLRTIDDIARTMDPTVLLAVLMACLSDRAGPPLLVIPGVDYRLADKVRRIRNDLAHGEGDYSDFLYVRDAINAINDLRLGLLNAQPRLSSPGPGIQTFGVDSYRQVVPNRPSEDRWIAQRTQEIFDAYSQGNRQRALQLAYQGVNAAVKMSEIAVFELTHP